MKSKVKRKRIRAVRIAQRVRKFGKRRDALPDLRAVVHIVASNDPDVKGSALTGTVASVLAYYHGNINRTDASVLRTFKDVRRNVLRAQHSRRLKRGSGFPCHEDLDGFWWSAL